ncbi:MAG: hypothetical protein GY798_16065 [Hyphomicrobiales bacterium]|nr:hypothetical protein [Hyphomicrobiales bacterium]
MSIDQNSPENDHSSDTATTTTGGRRRIVGIVAAGLIAVGVAGAFAGSAMSEDRGWGSKWHGSGHHGMMFKASLDPAEVDEKVGRMVQHLAIEIDATDQQTEQLTTIFVSAAQDLLELRKQAGDRGEAAAELIELLSGATVEPAAIEAFRAEKMALADQASRLVADTLVNAAEVMTPEQRTEIGDRLEFFVKLGSSHRR